MSYTLLLTVISLFFSQNILAQNYFTLSGSGTASAGQTKTYNVYGDTYAIVYTNWTTSGANATIGSRSNTYANYTFNAGGTSYVNAQVVNSSYSSYYLSKTVTVSSNAPSTPPTPTVTKYCGYTRLTRATPPSGVTYYWQSSSTGTSTSNSSSYVDRTSGSVYYLRARSNSNGLWSSARSVSYTINYTPGMAPLPSITQNCGSTTMTISTPPSGLTWYWQTSSTGTSTADASSSKTFTSGSVTYLRTRDNTSGCWSTIRTINYTIDNGPSAPSTPTITNNCGSTVLTRGTPPSGVTWYWQSTSNGTSTTNSATSVTRTTGTVYYLRGRNSNGCWGATRTINYTINSAPATPPTPTITNNCGSTRLTRGTPPSGVTYYWQSSSSGTSTSNSSSYVDRTSGTVYYLRARNNTTGCWSSVRTVNYSVNYVPGQAPLPTITNTCGSTTMTISTPPSGLTWYWQTSSTGTSTSDSSTSKTFTSGTVTYLRTRDNASGCWSTIRTINYTVDAVPSTPATPTADNTCGSTILTRGNPPTGVTWYWQSSASGTSTTNSASTISLTSGSVYYLRARNDASGCWSTNSSSVSYTVKYTPSMPLAPSVANNCGNTVLTMQAPPPYADVTYYWQSTATGTSTANTAQNLTMTSGTVYYIRAKDNVNLCWGQAYTVNYTVNQVPGQATGSNVSRCGSGNVDLIASPGSNGDTVRWYTAPTGGGVLATNTTYTVAVASTTTYYAETYNTATGCIAATRTPITAEVVPLVTYYLDADNDGHAVSSMDACSNPGAGYTTTVMPVDDCDDTNDTILGPLTWFLDADADGYPADLNTYYQCTSPGANYRAGPFSLSLDCDDNNPNSFPIKWYEDTDGDGLGNRRGNFVEQCSAPLTGGPWVTNNNDLCPDDPTNSCTILSSGPSYGPNYVYVRQYQKSASEMLAQESIDQTNFPFFTASEGVIQSITYYDGIGRASQQIGMDQSPVINAQKQDFVTHLEYDAYGRMTREYLPYSTSSGTMGSFRNDALTGTLSFYNTATFENTANPYSEKQFDGTPLNRLEKQGAPGAAWQIQSSGDDHSIEFDYHANTGTEVRRFEVDLTTGTDLVLDENGPNEYYAAHVLVKTITMDENHISGKNHTTEEFTDKSGRVVLKRTYADTDITGDGIPESEVAHDTYYVYDDYGNLTFVLSPQMKATTATFANIQSALDDLGYQYVYDSRNRLVEKKIPGKGWEYIVYNRLDQPIMTQDAMMRAANNTALTSDNWLFTKYDKFGRIAYTGKATATSGTTRTAIQNQVNGLTGDLWVNRTGSYFTMDGLNVYYDQGGYPDNAITSPEAVVDELLTVNYYDDYNFDRAGAPTSVTVFGQTSTSATKGLATGSHVKVLETTNWTTGVTYYDAKARAIRTITNNNYLGTTDEVSSLLDFAGKVLKVRTSHTKSATTIVTIDNYMYDHSGRLMSQTQCIGDVTMGDSCPSTAGATELIALNDYDAIGRLVSKKVGGDAATTVSSSAGLQTVDYEYNVRGWLKSINDTNLTDSALSLDSNDVWGFKIKYDDIADPNKQLFNGNISQTLWASSTSNPAPYNPVSHTYTFTYDAMNRLTDAADNTTNYSVGSLAYDLNGNILALSRQGHTNSGATSFGVMDELVYTYNDGNQLVKVLDNGDDTYGFKDVVDQATEYTYDANGNMVTDANKGITSITYNHLNLPATIVTSNGTISYVYDAVGTKLKKTAPSAVTEYAGNYIYQNGTLQFMGQSEGYITPNGMTGYDYVYQYKDHLGNIRLSYLDNGGTLEIVEENNYYPFGLKHKGYNNPPISPLGNNVAQKWNYNGTELDETSELYEMPLRRYDPAIVRWTSIDPVVHYDYSGYQAYDNNPVFWSDPSGADSKHDFLKDNQGRDKFDSFTGLYISPYERNPSSGQKIIDKVASKTLKTFANGIVTYNGEDIELGKLSENEKNYYFKNDSAITVAILLWEFASGAGRETREFTYGTHPFANAVMTNRYIAEVVARFIASGKKAGLSLHDLVESGQELEFGMPFSPDHTNFFDSLEKHVDAITGNLSQLFIGGANAKVSIRDGNINIMISNGTTRNSLLLHLDDRLKDHTDYFRNYDRSTDGNIPLSTIYQNLFYSNKVTIE